MSKKLLRGLVTTAAIALLVVPGSQSSAQERGPDPQLRQRIEKMERDLETLKRQLEKAEQKAEEAAKEAETAKEKATTAAKEAQAADRAYGKWRVTGYGSAGFTATDLKDEQQSFTVGSFNPIFLWQYKNLLLFEGELEVEVEDDGETELALEYAALNLFAHDYATLVAGKFLSPVGQFRERLHAAWINKLPDAPAGFGHGGVQPLSEIGAMARGGFPLGTTALGDMKAMYSLAVGNGPRVGDHGLELEGFGEDDNNNKTVSGRIGFLPLPFLEVGFSGLTAKARGVSAPSGTVTEGNLNLWGVDFAFTKGAWDIRGEYLNSRLSEHFGRMDESDESTSLIPATRWQAWYIQGAYKLNGLTETPILRNFEPVVRYGELRVSGNEMWKEDEEKRINFGLNYLFAPSIVAKFSVELRDFVQADREDETRVLFQIAYGF